MLDESARRERRGRGEASEQAEGGRGEAGDEGWDVKKGGESWPKRHEAESGGWWMGGELRAAGDEGASERWW